MKRSEKIERVRKGMRRVNKRLETETGAGRDHILRKSLLGLCLTRLLDIYPPRIPLLIIKYFASDSPMSYLSYNYHMITIF